MPVSALRLLFGNRSPANPPAASRPAERASAPVIRLGAAAVVKLPLALPPVPTQVVAPARPPVVETDVAGWLRTLELARLDALHHQGDDLFQLIARMAAQVCDAPIAAVTLLDDHTQWLQGSFGLEVAFMPLELSFCQHALHSPHHMTVIQDALNDPRVAMHPMVLGEPGLRFYAGAPLVTPQGLVMGTVCVLDTKPRTLTPAQNQTLCNLAEAFMRLLLLRAPADEAQALALSPRAA